MLVSVNIRSIGCLLLLDVLQETFHNVFDEESFKELVERGEHSFSYAAFQGAMMISLYRHEPRFHQPYMLLTLLMDIDALLIKWRCKLRITILLYPTYTRNQSVQYSYHLCRLCTLTSLPVSYEHAI